MADPTDKAMLETWKRQLDAAMRLTEVVIEGSERMREVQLEAVLEVALRGGGRDQRAAHEMPGRVAAQGEVTETQDAREAAAVR